MNKRFENKIKNIKFNEHFAAIASWMNRTMNQNRNEFVIFFMNRNIINFFSSKMKPNQKKQTIERNISHAIDKRYIYLVLLDFFFLFYFQRCKGKMWDNIFWMNVYHDFFISTAFPLFDSFACLFRFFGWGRDARIHIIIIIYTIYKYVVEIESFILFYFPFFVNGNDWAKETPPQMEYLYKQNQKNDS